MAVGTEGMQMGQQRNQRSFARQISNVFDKNAASKFAHDMD